MKTKLPMMETKIETVDGVDKLVKREYEKEFDIDMSLMAQLRWESNFPEQAKREEFVAYCERISKDVKEIIETGKYSGAKAVGILKGVYCYFDTEMSFAEFVKLFSASDTDYLNRLVFKITSIFTLIMEASSEKN